MIATTFRGEPVYLLHYLANWEANPSVRFDLIANVTRSLGGREARRAYTFALRTKHEFSVYLPHDDSAAFRVALQRLENKRILCPFWPAAHAYYADGGTVYVNPNGDIYVAPGGEIYVSGTGESPYVRTGIWLTFERDWSAWEIHETDAPVVMVPTASAVRVPLMLGVFDEHPEPKPYNARLLTCEVIFRQTAEEAFALRTIDIAFSNGPTLGARTPKIFPLRADWSQELAAGQATVEIDRQDVGYGPTPVETYYPQLPSRTLSLGFAGKGWSAIAKLIAFFHQMQGPVESFWIEGAVDECILSSPTTAESTQISVTKAAALGDNRFVAFVTSHDSAWILRRVLAVDTVANMLTLDASPGVFAPGQVRIVSLILARFKRATLSLRFGTTGLAWTRIGFVETPEEYVTPAGETIGQTMGGLGRKAYLFRFIREVPGGPLIDRFTSSSKAITAAGELFIPAKISHADIVDSLNPDQTKVKITSDHFPGNPLARFLPNRLEGPLILELLEALPDAAGVAGAPKLIFGPGKIKKPLPRGRLITCEAVHILQDLEGAVPTFLEQRKCNLAIFSGPCGVLEAAFTFTAAVVSASGTTLVINTLARNQGAMPAISAGYFAFGRVWVGSGATYQSREIEDASALAGGQITLEIEAAFDPAPVAVSLTPGCSGTVEDCRDKFQRYPRGFGASPHLPNGNPTLRRITENQTQGGKKS